MRKRTGKFYSKNEKETLRKLGFEPSPMSGAGWIIKEDGENDLSIVQLKSTDNSSYTLNLLDMKKLEYHADVSNKLPIFIVQFLKANKMYAIVSIDNIIDLTNAIKTGKIEHEVKIEDNGETIKRKTIKASKKSLENFYKEREEQYAKRGKRN